MFKQIIVTSDFVIPDVYIKGTVEEIEEALWIGATIQQSVKIRRSNDEVRKITELKDSEITRIQEMYNEKLKKLLDDIQSVTLERDRLTTEYSEGLKDALKQVRLTERDAVTREWEEKHRVVHKENELLTTRYEMLEARRHMLARKNLWKNWFYLKKNNFLKWNLLICVLVKQFLNNRKRFPNYLTILLDALQM
jgi:hypothetical protein